MRDLPPGWIRGEFVASTDRERIDLGVVHGYLRGSYWAVILEDFRGRGLSKWLMECVLGDPDLQGLRRFALFTRDAGGLYERFGFGPPRSRSTYLERWTPDVYGASTS